MAAVAKAPELPALARSALYAPGHKPRILEKAFETAADAVVLDLEDGVPRDLKDQARQQISETLTSHAATTSKGVWVRINGFEPVGTNTHIWRDDLAVLDAVPAGRQVGLRIPKLETTTQLDALDRALLEVEQRCDRPLGSIALCGLIESALGLAGALELARHPRVVQLAFGAADFVADVGAEPEPTAPFDNEVLRYAHAQLVVASRAAAISAPVLSVHTQLDDDAGLASSTEAGRQLGFFGRSCIHPRQLEIVNRVFTPSARLVADAEEILQIGERERGGAAQTESGAFVDEAIVRQARRIVELAKRIEKQQAPALRQGVSA